MINHDIGQKINHNFDHLFKVLNKEIFDFIEYLFNYCSCKHQNTRKICEEFSRVHYSDQSKLLSPFFTGKFDDFYQDNQFCAKHSLESQNSYFIDEMDEMSKLYICSVDHECSNFCKIKTALDCLEYIFEFCPLIDHSKDDDHLSQKIFHDEFCCKIYLNYNIVGDFYKKIHIKYRKLIIAYNITNPAENIDSTGFVKDLCLVKINAVIEKINKIYDSSVRERIISIYPDILDLISLQQSISEQNSAKIHLIMQLLNLHSIFFVNISKDIILTQKIQTILQNYAFINERECKNLYPLINNVISFLFNEEKKHKILGVFTSFFSTKIDVDIISTSFIIDAIEVLLRNYYNDEALTALENPQPTTV